MKTMIAATVMAAQLMAAPAVAASLEPVETRAARTGAFAGARFRVQLGGREAGRAQAGLNIGPVRSVQAIDGRIRTSFGEGVAFGISGKAAKPQLSFAGNSLDELRLQADGKGGVPTWALVVGGVVIVLGVAAAVAIDEISDNSE
jgi:hypothetical protein